MISFGQTATVRRRESCNPPKELAERKTRFMLAHPVRRRTKQETAEALPHLLSPIAAWVRTITYDNGREFSDHVRVARALACQDCFATPCRSCERGTNENGNGLLRQCLPKSMPLSQVRPEQVRAPSTSSTTARGNA